MLAVSFSKHHIRYAVVDEGVIHKVEKRKLSEELSSASIQNPEKGIALIKDLKNILNEVEIPQGEVVFSIPTDTVLFETVGLDADLSDLEKKEYLEWQLKQKITEYQSLFDSYFYKVGEIQDGKENYLIVLLNRRFGEYLRDFCTLNKIKPVLIDVAPISAFYGIKGTGIPTETSRIAIWKVMKEHNELTYFMNDEFRHFMSFTLSDEGTFEVLKSSSPDSFALDILNELTALDDIDKEYVSSLDDVYIYSDKVDSEYFNTLLAYQLANVHIINPFEGLDVHEMDEQDGTSPGALCQYLELAGVIRRFINGDF